MQLWWRLNVEQEGERSAYSACARATASVERNDFAIILVAHLKQSSASVHGGSGELDTGSQSVSNRLRLLELPEDVLGMVERAEITEGHARAILAVPDHDGRRKLARQIVRQGLSVRAAEKAARWAGARQKPRRAVKVDPALADRVRTRLAELTGHEARVASGRVEIPFADETELAELAEALDRLAVSD